MADVLKSKGMGQLVGVIPRRRGDRRGEGDGNTSLASLSGWRAWLAVPGIATTGCAGVMRMTAAMGSLVLCWGAPGLDRSNHRCLSAWSGAAFLVKEFLGDFCGGERCLTSSRRTASKGVRGRS